MVHKKTILVVFITIVLFLSAAVALAQSGGVYDLSWSSVDGGGHANSTGGSYALGGTIGQPDAGMLTGGSYSLGGGFWVGGSLAESGHNIYLPLVVR